MTGTPPAAPSVRSVASRLAGQDQSTFPEWFDPATDSPIRQGDVLLATPAETDAWRKLLIVITADCDLANSKHGGALTCVPILDLSKYILDFKFEKLRNRLVDRVSEAAIESLERENSSTVVPNLSPARLREWLIEDGITSVKSALSDLSVEGRTEALMSALRDACTSQPETVAAAADALAACKVLLGDAKDVGRAHASVTNDLADTLKSMPGDVVFLNEVSSGHSSGYVAYLRRVVEVNDDCVARTLSQLPHDAEFLRVSRLRAPYVYALTQQFAAVFSAIGLPTEYEEARDRMKAMIISGAYDS